MLICTRRHLVYIFVFIYYLLTVYRYKKLISFIHHSDYYLLILRNIFINRSTQNARNFSSFQPFLTLTAQLDVYLYSVILPARAKNINLDFLYRLN